MGDIGVSLEATYEVTLQYEVNNDEVGVSVLERTILFMPDLKCRLLIPRDHFMNLQILKNPEGSFTVTCYKSVIKLSDQVPINVDYYQTTHLTKIHSYKSINRIKESLNITRYVTSDNNQNLTHL